MKFEYSPHIAINIKDRNNAGDFYRRVLGMEFVEEKQGDLHFKAGTMNFYFAEGKPGETFLEFKVESVKEACELLVSEGCTVTKVYSEKSVMISDPHGVNFHIWEDGADLDN